MKTRTQIYGQEAASLLRDLSLYRTLTKSQILALYPGKQNKIDNLLTYLIKQKRIYQCDNFYCVQPDCVDHTDTGLLAAVWILIDFIDRVEYHSAGDYPAKIIFFADGEIYEIVHVAEGKEALINHLLSQQTENPSRLLLLMEKPEQITQMHVPNVAAYCMVSSDGAVQYFTKE